ANGGERGAPKHAVVAGNRIEIAVFPIPMKTRSWLVPPDHAAAVDDTVLKFNVRAVHPVDEPACPADGFILKSPDQFVQPLRMTYSVVVDESYQLAAGSGDPFVTG